jgi:hypothetical protein
MTDYEALDILRAQGHAAGIPDHNGWVRVWIRGGDDAIDVRPEENFMSLPKAS